MKRFLALLITCLAVTISFSASQVTFAKPIAGEALQKKAPVYVKWGKLAEDLVRLKYPSSQIIDYLHIGSKTVSPTATEEKFRFQVRQANREFSVVVTITYETKTERVISFQVYEGER